MKTRAAQGSCTLLTLFVLLALACSSAIKTLNEDSARQLLLAELKAKGNDVPIPLTELAARIKSPTPDDYMSGSYKNNDFRLPLQRLLKAGFLKQTREDIKYRNITGKYTAEPPGCGSGFFSINRRVYTFNLVMLPGNSTVTGGYTFESWWGRGPEAGSGGGAVTGSVDPDGVATLVYGPMRSEEKYVIGGDGTTVTLTGPVFFVCGTTQVTMSGSGPGGYVTVPRYSYAYSDKMTRLINETGQLRIGTKVIDKIENLLLQIDSIATADVTSHFALNEAGQAILGLATIPQHHKVTFRKRPDGTWVLPEKTIE